MKCRHCNKVQEDDAVGDFCPNCGGRLNIGEASAIDNKNGASVPDRDRTEPSRGVADAPPCAARINELQSLKSPSSITTGQSQPDARMLSLDLAGGGLFEPHQSIDRKVATHPLVLEFDAARRYVVGERGYLMLRAAAGQMHIQHGTLTVITPDGRRSAHPVPPLTPGAKAKLEEVELVPDLAGQALLDLRLVVLLAGGYLAYGNTRLLLPVEQKPGDMSIKVIAERDIFGLDGLDEIRQRVTPVAAGEKAQWTPLDFHLDETLARRLAAPQSTASPPGHIAAPSAEMVPGRIALIALRASGKADRVFVYGGTSIDIGRNARDVLLAPRATLAASVSGIRGLSKRHCEVRLEGDVALIVDKSSAGTAIDGARLPEDLAVRLAPDDLITLSDAIAYRVSLFGGTEGIAGLLLAEQRGDCNPGRYLLLRSAVPLNALFEGCDGWLCFDGEGFLSVAENGEEEALVLGGQTAGGRLQIDEAIRCRGCARFIVPLPEAHACIHCRTLNED